MNDCKENNIQFEVINLFKIKNLFAHFQSKTNAAIFNGYDVFDIDNPFYNGICTLFTNEYGKDVLLYESRADYFNEYLNLCKTFCPFISYNATTNYYSCKCPIKDTINQNNEET